jgi:NADH-quinone oxidoreductase subunit J
MMNLSFWIIAFFMTAFALGVVTARNILHGALSLIGTFFATAVLYLQLGAEFTAIAQVMVYIGGVVIFTLFTILLTTHLGEESLKTPNFRKITALLIAGFVFVLFLRITSGLSETQITMTGSKEIASITDVGTRLLNTGPDGFIVPFEIISLLLLLTMIGSIVIARKESSSEKEKK